MRRGVTSRGLNGSAANAGGQWFERPADSLSLWFMGGVSGSCGLALPSNRQCIVSHNSLQPLLQVGSDLQAVLVNPTAAAKTSATPAVVSFFFALFCTS